MIVVTGGRELAWSLGRIQAQLLAAVGNRPVAALFHGGARGADSLADQVARRLGWSVRPMLAQWSKHGISAGPIRNREMLRSAVATAQQAGVAGGMILVAFPGGKGTQHCTGMARTLRECGHPISIRSAS
ncbi:DUF2493 domain-containing protein [Synechococcus sp. J7-Johnson]|uniref:SLOG family protein n=1 Tax=Synechococcus sp. J7-Johnson TaxID=2823737 RepID=UPI0020CF44C7|nr:SLOG family protein [Synechococcus sp. J7-Johnson]MCP9841401.1 DUF2493 domain-containing protein [Synechococcus sp. J7-Johnson]